MWPIVAVFRRGLARELRNVVRSANEIRTHLGTAGFEQLLIQEPLPPRDQTSTMRLR